MTGISAGNQEVRQIYFGHQRVLQVFAGDQQIWPPRGREEIREITTVGSTIVQVPWWAVYADVVVLGGGGGGSGGDLVSAAECWGGEGGHWAHATLEALPSQFSARVGEGGARGPSKNGGFPGGDSRVTGPMHSVIGRGGAGGTGYGPSVGRSPGNYHAFDRTFRGGAEAGRTYNGVAPGGGGGAAEGIPMFRTPAGDGARGWIWIRFRSD